MIVDAPPICPAHIFESINAMIRATLGQRKIRIAVFIVAVETRRIGFSEQELHKMAFYFPQHTLSSKIEDV